MSFAQKSLDLEAPKPPPSKVPFGSVKFVNMPPLVARVVSVLILESTCFVACSDKLSLA